MSIRNVFRFTWSDDILSRVADLARMAMTAAFEEPTDCCDGACSGPCFDFCPCEHCWNGWTELSFAERLRGHVAFLWEQALQRQEYNIARRSEAKAIADAIIADLEPETGEWFHQCVSGEIEPRKLGWDCAQCGAQSPGGTKEMNVLMRLWGYWPWRA